MKILLLSLAFFTFAQIIQAQAPPVWVATKYRNNRVVNEKCETLSPGAAIGEKSPLRRVRSKNPDEAFPVLIVDRRPEFPGGDIALLTFLYKNIRYPSGDVCYAGRVIFQFTVNPDGKLSEFCIVRKSFPKLDEEVLRVARLMPDWTPGERNGIPVPVRMTIPLRIEVEP
ncbi:MAG TPA: energy transducer TonB [Flavilitoribacter sp.]|nr:energy transducer TonB [Flavilitoribacter sp.]HMQ89095.1 energy transducer TonB [Flavilitoribacter sp.]